MDELKPWIFADADEIIDFYSETPVFKLKPIGKDMNVPTTNEPTTGEIVEVLRENGDVYFGESEITCEQISDRLESQERDIADVIDSRSRLATALAELTEKIGELTARAEQAEHERDAEIAQIERLKSKQVALCSICEFEDMIGCVHTNHCDGFQLFKRRGLPQEGEGK